MLTAAIAAPKISFETFAMICSSASPLFSTRRRSDYIAADSITLSYNAEQYCAIAWRDAADWGEYRQASGGFAQDLPLSASGAWLTDVVLATTGTDWVHRTRLSRAGQPSIAPMLRTGTARVCQVYRCTTHRFAHQRVFQCRRQPRKLPE